MSEITEQTSKPDISKILQGKLQEIQNKIKEGEQAEQQKETNEGGWETVESSTIPKNATTGKKLTQTETNAFQTILNLAKPKDSSKENEEKTNGQTGGYTSTIRPTSRSSRFTEQERPPRERDNRDRDRERRRGSGVDHDRERDRRP
eukprot:UN05665